jgi:hypothetical protein
MSVVRADFDAIDEEHAFPVLWRVRTPGSIAVIREDDEGKAGATGGARDVVQVAAAV